MRVLLMVSLRVASVDKTVSIFKRLAHRKIRVHPAGDRSAPLGRPYRIIDVGSRSLGSIRWRTNLKHARDNRYCCFWRITGGKRLTQVQEMLGYLVPRSGQLHLAELPPHPEAQSESWVHWLPHVPCVLAEKVEAIQTKLRRKQAFNIIVINPELLARTDLTVRPGRSTDRTNSKTSGPDFNLKGSSLFLSKPTSAQAK